MAQFTRTTPPDFHYLPTVLSHGWSALPPFTYEDAGVLGRTEKLREGKIVRFDVRAGNGGLTITTRDPVSAPQQVEIGGVVARCLSFEHNLVPFYDSIRGHAAYEWIERVGAGRMLTSPTVWEDLAKTLLTTNTTWAMTISMVSRLVTLGDSAPEGGHAFPEPEQIAALDPDSLNAHVRAGYRGAYLYGLATAIASGELEVRDWEDLSTPSSEVYKALKRIKGFGDYAAGAMLRLLGRFDQLGLDSVCRAMYAERYNGGVVASDREIAAYYAPFGDWKGLVVWMDVMRDYILNHLP
jgi:3-methyladenine DNA glycosylase/8-oxoguanine DNA glycosylase